MNAKTELRNAVASDIEKFLATGGKVTVCKSVTFKTRHPASGKQKLFAGWSEPKNRPSNPWDFIEAKRG